MHSLSISVKEKRLTSDICALREALANGDIDEITHVPTKSMVADGLTKTNATLKDNIVFVMNGFLNESTNK